MCKGKLGLRPIVLSPPLPMFIQWCLSKELVKSPCWILMKGVESGAPFWLTTSNSPSQETSPSCFFLRTDRGQGFFFDEPKRTARWFNNYFVLVCDDKNSPGKNSINIYDLNNQLVVFSGKFDTVQDIIIEWASLFVVSTSGTIQKLSEKDLSKKMELLFKRNMYQVAINMAKSQQVGIREICEIHKEFGDYLYSTGEFDNAVMQYIETIKDGRTYIEPSYIIRKFLDSQRIDNLTTYLEALHANKCANKDHTTLLLNCFTKSKDVAKLEHFIKESTSEGDAKDEGPNFDIETAINVCRQAGYFNHAMLLAKKHAKNDMYLKILVEETREFSSAIEAISNLKIFEAEQALKQYGQELIFHEPEKMTELLKKLCTDFKSGSKPSQDSKERETLGGGNPPIYRARAEEFMHIFVKHQSQLESFLEHVVSKVPDSDPSIYNTLLELYLRTDQDEGKDDVKDSKHPKFDKIMQLLTAKQARYNDEHALLLTKIYKFEDGMIYLYKRQKLYNQILQHYIQRDQNDKIIRLCQEYEQQDSSLWTQALTYFSMKGKECQDQLREVLRHIDSNNLLPPLMVIRMLQKNSQTPIGIVKDYLTRKLQEDNTLIEAHEVEIQQLQEESMRMKDEIRDLQTNAKTYQNTKCNVCKNTLDLPAVHFLCMHSYHVRCLQESDDECPLCSPDYRKVLDIKEKNVAQAQNVEVFNKLLHKDGFEAIAEYFKKGILTAPPEEATDEKS
eukprot:TRINITY_DN12152_c0_g1_i2.p1 TRINITY_DN12152_c0_g1~~TRINITY_DN12152_c0_g1_i2.p1  ORF type:complete len:731 (-),score=192.03 TRINITY_DN12152_c0_g1_i2:68-2260(-)